MTARSSSEWLTFGIWILIVVKVAGWSWDVTRTYLMRTQESSSLMSGLSRQVFIFGTQHKTAR